MTDFKMSSSSSSVNPLKILIHPMDGSGHISACTGMAQSLAERGHQIIFIVNIAFKGQFCKFGFQEIHLIEEAQTRSQMSNTNPVKATAEIIMKELNLLNGKSPLQKLKDHQLPEVDSFMINLTRKVLLFDPQIETVLVREKPDLVILDHFLISPAFVKAQIPWIFLFSGNPVPMYNSPSLLPYGSGYATLSEQSNWLEFQSLIDKIYCERYKLYQMKLYRQFSYEPTKVEISNIEKSLFPKSQYLNIYGFPQELDYDDLIPIPERFVRVDAFCQKSTKVFDLPEGFVNSRDKLIYFSLGSMGSVDVELMKRIVAVLGKTPHKCIVSKGPLADEYELPDNCWGQEFLPQTQILPLADLVITHGGNNTVTETFSFGKPMIVLPLFADQYDNAQRIEEKNYGIRLNPYDFEDHQLIEAIDRLLIDKSLHDRLQAAAKRIETSNSKVKVCERIESLVPFKEKI